MNLLSADVKSSGKWNGLLSKLLVKYLFSLEIFLGGRIFKIQKRVGHFLFLIGKPLNNVVDLSTFHMIST